MLYCPLTAILIAPLPSLPSASLTRIVHIPNSCPWSGLIELMVVAAWQLYKSLISSYNKMLITNDTAMSKIVLLTENENLTFEQTRYVLMKSCANLFAHYPVSLNVTQITCVYVVHTCLALKSSIYCFILSCVASAVTGMQLLM